MNQRFYRASRRNGELAFFIVVIASFVVTFTSGETRFRIDANGIIAVLCGLLYTFIGIVGARFIEERRNIWLTLAYFVVEIPLGGLIVYLSRGNAWLIMMPVVGSAVEYLRKPYAVIMCGVIWAAMTVSFTLLIGWGNALAWGMPFLAAVVFVAVFTQSMVSEAEARTQLAQANKKLIEYAAAVEELAVTQERNRLAREIHDGLGHYLTAVNIQLKAAQALAEQNPAQAQEALQNAQTLTTEALADVRRSISALRSDPATSRPLPETLGMLLAEARAADLQTGLQVMGDARPLPPQVEFTLYRTAQESLTNVRKHARASQVNITLTYLPHSVALRVQDDGAGAEDIRGGFGLTGLRERISLVNGSLQVHTAPGQGFRLEVSIPTA